MANLRNAIKQIRKDAKLTEHNMQIREDLKTLMKKTRKAIDSNAKNIDEMLEQTQKSIDKAVQKNIIKKNSGARKLSRLFSYKKKAQAK